MSNTLQLFHARIRWLGGLAGFAFVLLVITTGTTRAQGTENADDPVAIFNQAQEVHEKGDLPAAILLYEKALKIMPEFPEAEYQRAIALLALGKPADAEKGFRRAVELRGDWTLALTSLGSVLLQQAKYGEAETVLTKAIDLDTQNYPALQAMTELRLKTKASPAALNSLLAKITDLTTKASLPPSVWVARAALQQALGLNPAARISIDKALAIDPKNKYAVAKSAEIALADGDTERAAADADVLEKISPRSKGALLIQARIFAHDGKIDEAIKILDSISTPSADTTAFRSKLIANGSNNRAELEKQIAIDPKDPMVLGKLCSLFRRDDPMKALDYCRRASEAEPENVDHAIGFGAALVQNRQFEPAVGLLKKLIEIVPNNWTAHANLATALFQLKRYQEAKAQFEWLTIKQPKSPTAYYFLAIIHDQLDEYLDALVNYQQYLRLADPVQNKLDIEKINLRLPSLQKQIKEGKGKKDQ